MIFSYVIVCNILFFNKLLWVEGFVAEDFAAKSKEIVEKAEYGLVKSGGYCVPTLDNFFCILSGNYKVHFSETSSVATVSDSLVAEISTLKSNPSINEAVMSSTKGVQLPNKENLSGLIKSKNSLLTELPVGSKTRKSLMANVSDAITRTLNFYGSHLDKIKTIDTVFALLVLKEIDDKHQGKLQKEFPLKQWTQQICEQASSECSSVGDSCKSLSRQWKIRTGPTENQEYWKSETILEKYVDETDSTAVKYLGDEKEESWSTLIGQCQMALYPKCEIPYVCERTLLDPTPRSQYFLTHQLLQRMFIDNADCPSNPAIESFVTEEKTYNDLCGKILLETKYLDVLDVPQLYRDLFAEMIGLCGNMGYTNFLREDWLNRIISWQSKSEFGCFFKSPEYPVDYFSTDIGFGRKATKKEQEQQAQTNEKCLPHFTATSLLALTAHYDYLLDTQNF